MFKIIDIPENNPCTNCNPCLRLRLMEMGFITGEKIEIVKNFSGLKIVNILNEFNNVTSTIALREEEFSMICLKEVY
jgi:Fe2+ transport system protein FeoA